MYNFACVCYGEKYKPEYVQKLYNMVQRNTTVEYNFVVFTDHVKMSKLVDGDIDVRQFKLHDLQGWWNKMQLFSPDSELYGTTLYMDLDVVITENIDCFFKHEPNSPFVGMNDFNPQSGVFNSSIMKFKSMELTDKIWNNFINNKGKHTREPGGDQIVISNLIKSDPQTESFPDDWTQSYKWYDRSGTRYHKSNWTFEHNGKSKVTVFHGKPDPHESEMEWVKNAWK